MKYNTFIAVLLAAALLFALAACGTKQAPAPSGQPDPTTRQTEPQNSSEPSESTESPTHGDEVSEEEAWKKGFEESLFIEFGLTPKYYEDLGAGSIRSMWTGAARSFPSLRSTPRQAIITDKNSGSTDCTEI